MVAERLRSAGIDEPMCLKPLSDGGEGIASVIMPEAVEIAKGIYSDPARRYSDLAVSSEIIGFEAFAGKNIPLMERSSFALGEAVRAYREISIAVGGTATSDCGAGFLQALGARFFDRQGKLISKPLTPRTLPTVASADLDTLQAYRLSGIIDVTASLVAPPLSALDFARQKALEGECLDGLREALAHFQSVVGGSSKWDGAGGGLGYALASVCKAPCHGGAEAVIDSLDIDWSQINFVITGEGKVDRQTALGGKLVDTLFRKATSLGIGTLVLYGAVDDIPMPYPHMAQIDSPWEKLELFKNF